MDPDKRELFLMEYEDLCKKHRMIVETCDGDESPWIYTEQEIQDEARNFEKVLTEHISHLGES